MHEQKQSSPAPDVREQRMKRMLSYELDSRAHDLFTADAARFPEERGRCKAPFEENRKLLERLAGQIAATKPPFTHVVLVSHKMPRLADALDLRFHEGSRVVSDFALPWIAHELHEGAPNIAIVDDSINWGRTIDNARERVKSCLDAAMQECIAREEEEKGHKLPPAFALFGKKASGRYCLKGELSQTQYDELASKIALRLLLLNKPYQLEFPVLTFRYAAKHRNAGELFADLREGFGEQRLSSLTHPLLAGTGLYRFALTGPPEENAPGNRQIRFYADDVTRECRVVPMHPATGNEIAEPIAAMQDKMKRHLLPEPDDTQKYCGETFSGEAERRLDTFAASLDFGLRVLPDFSGLLSPPPEPESILSERDMIFLFGKAEFYNIWENIVHTALRGSMHGK